MDEDRLAELALTLAQRVHTDDPDDNADWLLTETSERDRWQLLFALAAVAPTSADRFQRAKAWAKPAPESVDDIAVERACRGEPVPLNRLEIAAAVKRLRGRGCSINATAERLRVDRRQVVRITGDKVQWSRGVA